VRRCKHCQSEMPPASKCVTFIGKQRLCSDECAVKWSLRAARKAQEKKRRKETAKARERLKTRSDWLRDAQKAFNGYIRARDKGKPCISCQRHHQGQYHAGHYRTTKAAPQHRYNTFNCWSQCSACNTHLSGNITEYRINLVRLIGVERVERIEHDNHVRRYDIDYLKRLKRIFSKRARHVERLRSCTK